MTWPNNPRPAKSLIILREQINAFSPNRDKSSDGMLASSPHHAANPNSDHEAHVMDGSVGVVTALDISNDPSHGVVSEDVANKLLASRDGRIKYLISNKKIASGHNGPQPWVWRSYNGKNTHAHHFHVSVLSDKAHYDDVSPWNFSLGKPMTIAPKPDVYPTVPKVILSKGDKGESVILLQSLLNKHGMSLKEDGDFGKATDAAVRIFQKAHNLVADGIIGRYSWEALEGKP